MFRFCCFCCCWGLFCLFVVVGWFWSGSFLFFLLGLVFTDLNYIPMILFFFLTMQRCVEQGSDLFNKKQVTAQKKMNDWLHCDKQFWFHSLAIQTRSFSLTCFSRTTTLFAGHCCRRYVFVCMQIMHGHNMCLSTHVVVRVWASLLCEYGQSC